jgi:hypothetical protein
MSTVFSQFELFESSEDGNPSVHSTDSSFSDFIVYVDESGDHSLASVDATYPVFVLSFCIFHKKHYAEKVIPAVEKLKFNTFGHDSVVLHENEIRKQKGPFAFLSHALTRISFMQLLDTVLLQSNFILIACVVDKAKLNRNLGEVTNPYHLALGECLEALKGFLQEKMQTNKTTHIVVECRGKKEDAELELEFLRLCDQHAHPFKIVFADKKTNSVGLQVADLVARPVGIHVLRPDQKNRAFEILRHKFYCAGGRNQVGKDYLGYGLRILPAQKSERPR